MQHTETIVTDWLGLPCSFTQPASAAAVPGVLGQFLNSEGSAVARQATEVELWRDERALYLRARCGGADMERIRELAARKPAYGRDDWGNDALEVQIDPGLTREAYFHFILPPTGIPVTLRGFNNRQVQGWHPEFDFKVTFEDDAWVVEAAFPFAILGRTPEEGEAWGLNVLRVNPGEPGGYVQWAPTFGDALRPELFGTITFSGTVPIDRQAQIDAYLRRCQEREAYFHKEIDGIHGDDALAALGFPDWPAWDEYLAAREHPLPLRWDGITPEEVPEIDQPFALELAEKLVRQIAGWAQDEPEAFHLERLEPLADAYLIIGDRRYAKAFKQAVRTFNYVAYLKRQQAEMPHHRVGAGHPYHDYQICRAAILTHLYLTMRAEARLIEVPLIVMETLLRSARFAAFNIRTAYNFGNHQIYESASLAIVAALFPEFKESDEWAQVASRSIRLHLKRELYPDGGYLERCGYHWVAMSNIMQAVATVTANGQQARFGELITPEMLEKLTHMHEWLRELTAPDGAIAAFGDFGANPMRRDQVRGAALFGRPDLLQPAAASVSLPSHYTVMRDEHFFMAVDHGPLGGQHSHPDTMSFVAYGYGHPVALDTGSGASYDDPRYVDWFRKIRAHNVVAIDDAEPEKVVALTAWQPGEAEDVLSMRSDAYQHAYGILHDRTIRFIKGVGWIIHDRLTGKLDGHNLDWLLHTPAALEPMAPGMLAGDGLLVLAGNPEVLQAPILEPQPASVPVPEVADWRLWDATKRFGGGYVKNITGLTWRQVGQGESAEFIIALVPYQRERPEVRLVKVGGDWELLRDCPEPA
ncbi:MAG: heparinase II/III domain-containing protein [Armatimonadota bacterium]